MKRYFLISTLLLTLAGLCQATQIRDQVIVSTKTQNVAYKHIGSQEYDIGPDTTTTIIKLSSSTADFGGLTLTNCVIPIASTATYSTLAATATVALGVKMPYYSYEYLRPNGQGGYNTGGSFPKFGGNPYSAIWQDLNEATPDFDVSVATALYYTHSIENLPLTSMSVTPISISSVTVYAVVKGSEIAGSPGQFGGTYRSGILISGTTYWGTTYGLYDTPWTTVYDGWTTNPATSLPWQTADISGVRIVMDGTGNSGNGHLVITQVYLQIAEITNSNGYIFISDGNGQGSWKPTVSSATYANTSSSATYANTSSSATYANTSSTATFASTSSSSTYATTAGSATSASSVPATGITTGILPLGVTAQYALTSGSGGGSTASGNSIKQSCTQTAHGFSVGMAVYWNGSNWIRSQANTAASADALGIIDTVGVDTFSITMQGYISGLSGLTNGSIYFISATSSGTLTTTEPTTYGYVSKPMLFALGTSSGIVVNMRGVVVTQAGVYDGVPVGGFIWYSTTTAPSDFLYCNGSAVSRTTYSALFANLGTRYGSGDGSTTFNLPDGRGLFIRQLDDGKGIDPDGSFRVAGSTQTNAFQGHKNTIVASDNGSELYGITASGGGGSARAITVKGGGIDLNITTVTDGTNGTPRTASETRPSNMALCLMIKYRVNISTQGGILDQTNTWTAPQIISTITWGNGSGSLFGNLHSTYTKVVADLSTSGTGWSDIAGSTVAIITQGGTKLEWSYCSSGYNSTSGSNNEVDIILDNVAQGNATFGSSTVQVNDTTGSVYPYVASGQTDVVSAGTHYLRLQSRCTSGTLHLRGDVVPIRINVKEIKP